MVGSGDTNWEGVADAGGEDCEIGDTGVREGAPLDKTEEVSAEAVVEPVDVDVPTFRNPSLTRTFPPTPIPANVVEPPPDPSVIPNSRPRTLSTASSPLLPKMTSVPFDSCSKCSSTSVKVAVGGNVPVNRIGGSEHCNANVIGLDASHVTNVGKVGWKYLLRR